MHDDDLTPEERAALAALPREHPADPALEERTVRALRAGGWLAPTPRRLRDVPRSWLAVGAAAAIALFAGGFALGQRIESHENTELLVAIHERDAARVAAEVQRTGSAYVRALSALSAVADSSRAPGVREGREVAVNALYAVADQMVQLSPDDPLSARILQAFDRGAGRDTTKLAGGIAHRRVVWF